MKQLAAGMAVLLVCLSACGSQQTVSTPERTPGGSAASPVTIPPGSKTPGERQPVVGFLAVISILVAAGAGLYIYRVIRKGL